MSLLRVAASLASSFFFSSFALAQVSAPSCTSESWQWVWIPCFRRHILWHLYDLMDCVQTYNSAGQSPCTVTAYLMATCDGGREFFLFVCVSGPCSLISFQSTISLRCSRDCRILARQVLAPLTCATAIPSRIRSLVHVMRAKESNGWRAVHCVLFSIPGGLCIYY
jgi:hypothetical protein